MSDATALGGSGPRVRLEIRAILRMAALGMLWAGFLTWCWIVMRGPAIDQAILTLERLGLILLTYLVALTVWILVRTWLHQINGDRVAETFEEPAFINDYFGREVSVMRDASFGDQHLVLDYSDGVKRYRAPVIEEEAQTAVASSLQKLAAAAGAHGSAAPEHGQESDDALGQEFDVRDLRSH